MTLAKLKVLQFQDKRHKGAQLPGWGHQAPQPWPQLTLSSSDGVVVIHPLCVQAAFEQVVVRFPQATAKLMEGMTRRLAAASTVRQLPPTFDPFGHAASSATAAVRGTPLGTAAAPGGQGVQRGEIVTIALVPAGGLEQSSLPHGRLSKLGQRLSMLAGAPPKLNRDD